MDSDISVYSFDMIKYIICSCGWDIYIIANFHIFKSVLFEFLNLPCLIICIFLHEMWRHKILIHLLKVRPVRFTGRDTVSCPFKME